MKKECDIVTDLLPDYIENLLSDGSKSYVEEHLRGCNNCKQKLKIMQANIEENNVNHEKEEKIELNHLKKYRNRMWILKAIIYVFILIILTIFIFFVTKLFKTNNIINNARSKKEALINLDNYSVYTTLYHIDYKTQKQYVSYNEYFYKNGKYYEKSKMQGINFTTSGANISLSYGDISNNSKIRIFDETKTIKKYNIDSEKPSSEKYINNLFEFYSLYLRDLNAVDNLKLRIGLVLNSKMREDNFNGKKCYVFRKESEEYYHEIWIDRNSLIPIKEIQEVYGKMHDEKIILLNIGNVKDEDVNWEQNEKYNEYKIKTIERDKV